MVRIGLGRMPKFYPDQAILGMKLKRRVYPCAERVVDTIAITHIFESRYLPAPESNACGPFPARKDA